MSVTIEPEPTEDERDAILAALETVERPPDAWAEAALLEGVGNGEPEP